MCLYSKYVGLLPAEGKSSALYKYSLVKRKPNVWYTDKPVGVKFEEGSFEHDERSRC